MFSNMTGEEIKQFGGLLAKLRPTQNSIMHPDANEQWVDTVDAITNQFTLNSARAIFKYTAYGRSIQFIDNSVKLYNFDKEQANAKR